MRPLPPAMLHGNGRRRTDGLPRTRDGDPIEVLDQLPALPPGWGPDGPLDCAGPPAGPTAPRATIVDVVRHRAAIVSGPAPTVTGRPVRRRCRRRRQRHHRRRRINCRPDDRRPVDAGRSGRCCGRRGAGGRVRAGGLGCCRTAPPATRPTRRSPPRPRPARPRPPLRPRTRPERRPVEPHPAHPASSRPPPQPSRRRTSAPGTPAPGSRRVTGAPASTGLHWRARWPTAAISGGRLADRFRPERPAVPGGVGSGRTTSRQRRRPPARPPGPRPSRERRIR